ncbi:MAG: hypothetical protein ACLVJH_12545, partial [Faecalibacterium prausnitzii]
RLRIAKVKRGRSTLLLPTNLRSSVWPMRADSAAHCYHAAFASWQKYDFRRIGDTIGAALALIVPV